MTETKSANNSKANSNSPIWPINLRYHTSGWYFYGTKSEATYQGGLQGSPYRCLAIWQRAILQKMFPSRHFSQKIGSQSQKNVIGRTLPANFPKFVLILYGLLKMSKGQMLPDPDLELINVKSLDFTKPKLFFKNIG